MAPRVVHAKVSGKAAGGDATRVYGTHWDADHTITGLTIGSDVQAWSAELDRVARYGSTPSVNASLFGAASGADCASALVAAVTYLQTLGGGEILFPAGDFNLSTVISTTKPIIIRGAGHGGGRGMTTNPRAVTRIKWTGAVGGTMIQMHTPAAGPKIIGGGLIGVSLDGDGIAAIGLSAKSVENARFDFHEANFTDIGMRCGVVASIADGDNRYFAYNDIWLTGSQGFNAGGMLRFESDATASCIYNRIPMLSGTISNSPGLDIQGGDSNEFGTVYFYLQGGGTASSGVLLRAGATALQTASYNKFGRMNPSTAGLIVQGTGTAAVAANYNVIDIYDTVDGAPAPSTGTGVVLTWTDNATLISNHGASISVPVAGYNIAGTPVLQRSGNYTQITQTSGSGGATINLGNSGDPTAYVDGTTIKFRSLGGAATFGQWSSSGMSTALQITSTLATGTAPFVVASTTQVANLNAATAGTATNATNGTTASTSTNASFFPLFAASSSNGNQPFNLGTGLTFNPSTNTLTTTTFSGALSGNATTATSATTATNATNSGTTDDTTTNATMYPTWVTANTGNLPRKVTSTKYTFNPSTGTVSSTNVNVTAQYLLAGASFALQVGNYNQIADPSGTVVFSFGNTGDPTIYSDNTTAKWRTRGGGSTFAQLNATTLNVALATAIPAGGTTGTGIVVSSTSNFGVFFGSGVPTLSAAKGSLYLRSDGSSTSTRMYVNTDGSTTWTNVVTAA